MCRLYIHTQNPGGGGPGAAGARRPRLLAAAASQSVTAGDTGDTGPRSSAAGRVPDLPGLCHKPAPLRLSRALLRLQPLESAPEGFLLFRKARKSAFTGEKRGAEPAPGTGSVAPCSSVAPKGDLPGRLGQ